MEKSISRTTIDQCLWDIKFYLVRKFGSDATYHDMLPLNWYIGTGRASTPFLKLLINAKPFMVARILHKSGSYCEAVKRVNAYLGYFPSGL